MGHFPYKQYCCKQLTVKFLALLRIQLPQNILIDIFIITVENENSGGQKIGLPKNIKSKQETFASKKYELED